MALSENPAAEGGPGLTAVQRWAILACIVLSGTLYSLAILVVSVLLPQMQGSLSATQDQISWAMTFNILATAVVTPMTGWLTARFGRRPVMLWSTGGFTLATLGCGLSDSLLTMVLWRIVQGGCGAPLVPLGQAVILDTFPREQHGKVTAIFGMGVVVGPVIGPALGGYLAELYNWRWAFYMIVPLGLMALLGLALFLTDKGKEDDARLDWTGFLALSVAVICLQLMLSRGQRQGWFESPEIVIEAAMAVLAFYVFAAHTFTARRPFLNPKLLLDRNYAVGLVVVTIYGMLNFTPMVLLPPMLQDLLGFPDSAIGLILGFRGVGAVGGFFAAMWLSKLDPRVGMCLGYSMQAVSGWFMAEFGLEITITDVAIHSIFQGLAVGIIWVPLTVATFSTLDPRHLAESSAVFHLLRNLGSSVFISLSVTIVIVTGAMNYADLTEFINPFNELLRMPEIMGGWSAAPEGGLARLENEVARQAALIGYVNAFYLYSLTSAAAVPLILLMRVKRRKAT
ncbi:DHA2 family efflux MFS transporter permease subunit [Minwuia thermotolerans]|uniref:MFS transporter n=1 Tax=Minwuia thermotolerans TaxID=2056226 RepID=A0A2M9FWD6_9PROT|nr:DHA2 family efflux MFS transporter permease subunit [Minwuia thermotolerans]PJK27785.1 MFS transporter [Minwuia thermotolerans]